MRPLAPIAASIAVALGLPAAAAGDAADYQFEKIVLRGDPDPVIGTINFSSEVSIADGRVTFWGYTSVGGDGRVYVVEDGVLSIAVAEGDVAAGTGGATFGDVSRSRVASSDALAYSGIFPGGIGAFLLSGATHEAIALPGDPLPGGGTLAEVSNLHSAAPGPWVAFGVEVDTGAAEPVPAHVVHGPSGLREVYREGTAAPAGVGGVFSPVETFREWGVAADGSVTFAVPISGGSAASGIFRQDAAGTLTTLLLEGDAVATPGGGTFTGFGLWSGVNSAGDVAIGADVLRPPAGFSREAVFVLGSGGAQREIAIRGGAVAAAPPAAPLFGGMLGSSPPEVSDAGTVVFTAYLEDAEQVSFVPAVVVDDGSGPAVLVKEGDPVPGLPGVTFNSFDQARIDGEGRIAFSASTIPGGSGIFLATRPSEIPALPGWGVAALVAVLMAVRRVR